ncbi:hypothetical protein BDW22DRAFT_1353970 [Trametopsis cervina]|nr:hypothetical protein BDW22DRAFT_1353970 [Trametopsis cervina]
MPPVPASPFAALLRRSKFSSLDTSIAQVYTSSGGDLSRGNWGLKRPLPQRRKGAYITVRAVDSKEQQTEWDHAEQQGRWIQMWDEVGITPKIHGGPWITRLGTKANATEDPFDSEYARKVEVEEHDEAFEAPPREAEEIELTPEEQAQAEEQRVLLRMLEPGPGASMPNVHAMSESEFEKYLEKVRAMRPTFEKYRSMVAKSDRREQQETFWQDIPDDHGNMFKTFLAKNAENEVTSSSSRVIEQQPQQSAALTYTRSSLLQSQLLNKPQRGRLLGINRSPETTQKGYEYRASFAGMVPYLNRDMRGDASEYIQWRKLAETGMHTPGVAVTKFRLIDVDLRETPTVVGDNKNNMGEIYMEAVVRGIPESDLGPERIPGTREYSGYDSRRPKSPYTKSGAGAGKAPRKNGLLAGRALNSFQKAKPDKEIATGDILDSLQGILESTPPAKNGE